jgi:hypothetical protein
VFGLAVEVELVEVEVVGEVEEVVENLELQEVLIEMMIK